MKTIVLRLAFLGTVSVCASASSIVPGAHNRHYAFDDWSAPVELTAPGNSQERLLRQSCKVRVLADNGNIVREDTLEAVYDAGGRSLWVGREQEKYFVLNHRIYGIEAGLRLSIRGALERSGTDLEAVAAAMEDFLAEFAAAPEEFSSPRSADLVLDLPLIFTREALIPRLSSRVWCKPASIRAVAVDGSELEVLLATAAGNELKLVLSPDLELIAALENGFPVTVIRDARFPISLPEWSVPRRFTIQAAGGPVQGLSTTKSFEDTDRVKFQQTAGVRAVFASPGFFWAGPDECQLALLKNRLVGLTLVNRQVTVFAGPETVLPSTQAAEMFEEQVNKFEGEILGGTFKPTSSLDIAALFPNDTRVSGAPEITLKNLSIDDSALFVTLRVTDKHLNLRLRMSSDLRVESTEITVSP